MNKWLEIPSAQRAQILQQIAIARHLDATAIEKDWWVTMCLTTLFQCRCADYINFKGGTSLSKCWHLIDRMSRHLYDIAMMKDKPFAKEALADTELYKSIVHHRETLTHVSGIDYFHHAPQYIKIVPTGETEQAWRNDYESMLRTMIYGNQISFDEIMKMLTELQRGINNTR